MTLTKKNNVEDWWADWQINLVSDNNIVWTKKTFKKSNGYWIEKNGTKLLAKLSENETIPEGSVLEKNVWNHEHCSLCLGTISEEKNDLHEGYTDDKNNWVCEKCYCKYINVE